jgi:hypothetical protein
LLDTKSNKGIWIGQNQSLLGSRGIEYISPFSTIIQEASIRPVHPIPEGYHSITPYLVVPGVAKLVDFLKQAFGAELTHPPMTKPDGTVMHAEVQIGDSRIMMGDASGSKCVARPAVL